MTDAPLTAASKAYIVKVGGESTILSPGSRQQRITRSISSSAPHPTCRYFYREILDTPSEMH